MSERIEQNGRAHDSPEFWSTSRDRVETCAIADGLDVDLEVLILSRLSQARPDMVAALLEALERPSLAEAQRPTELAQATLEKVLQDLKRQRLKLALGIRPNGSPVVKVVSEEETVQSERLDVHTVIEQMQLSMKRRATIRLDLAEDMMRADEMARKMLIPIAVWILAFVVVGVATFTLTRGDLHPSWQMMGLVFAIFGTLVLIPGAYAVASVTAKTLAHYFRMERHLNEVRDVIHSASPQVREELISRLNTV